MLPDYHPNSHPDKYINALLTNDLKMLTKLYEEFSPAVKRRILQNKGTVEDAGDILQESLFDIFQKAKAGNLHLKSGFGNYLYQVCANKWNDKLKERKRFQKYVKSHMNLPVGTDPVRDGEEFALHQQLLKLVMEKFLALRKRTQEIVLMCLEDNSMKQVAEKLNLDYNYLRKFKCKNLQTLRELIVRSPMYAALMRN